MNKQTILTDLYRVQADLRTVQKDMKDAGWNAPEVTQIINQVKDLIKKTMVMEE